VEVQNDDARPEKPKVTGKITDFGLSWILGEQFREESSQYTKAIRWRDPELAHKDITSIKIREQYMEKADVWSFALTSLEVCQSLQPARISDTHILDDTGQNSLC
jgi:serine/threonine protein kinase